MPTKNFDTADHNVAESRQNRIAGRILLRARQVTGLNQTEFAAEVARRLKLPSIGQSALSGWEIHIRTVPAAALIAAVEVARSHGFDLAEAISAELGPNTVPQAVKIATALETIADALKGEASDEVRAAAESLRAATQRKR